MIYSPIVLSPLVVINLYSLNKQKYDRFTTKCAFETPCTTAELTAELQFLLFHVSLQLKSDKTTLVGAIRLTCNLWQLLKLHS